MPLLTYVSLLVREYTPTVKKRRLNCYRKFEYAELDSYKKLTNSGAQNHARCLRALHEFVTKTGFRFSPTQEKLRDEIIGTILPTLYGKDLMENLSELREKYQLKLLSGVMAALLPRRDGKTIVTTRLLACWTVSQKGNVTSYQIGSRQARMWLEEILEGLEPFKDSDEFGWTMEHPRDIREFFTIRTRAGHCNKVSAYPGSTQGNGNISCGHRPSVYPPLTLIFFFRLFLPPSLSMCGGSLAHDPCTISSTQPALGHAKGTIHLFGYPLHGTCGQRGSNT